MLRRNFLRQASAVAAVSGLTPLLPPKAFSLEAQRISKSSPEDFDFVFFTDTHLEPELAAAEGCEKCFHQINQASPDFCIAGGDQVFDICEQDLTRARELFELYHKTESILTSPVRHTIGNHDVTGINQKSPFEPGDLYYGKKLYQDNFGPRYYSFDYKNWHFIVLDSVGIEYYKIFSAHFDGEQLRWLEKDLAQTGPERPIIVVTHVPIASILGSLSRNGNPTVSNSTELHSMLYRYNVKLVLQGHLHIWEKSQYRGREYLIGGAVSGFWWKGAMEDGSHEGYTLCQVRGSQVTTSYITYPWTVVS